MIMKLVTIYILLLMLLLSCTSKKDSNIQATIDSLFIYDNHPTLEISEAKHLQWVDSVLGVKNVRLIAEMGYTNMMIQGFIGIELLIIFWYIPLALHMGKNQI